MESKAFTKLRQLSGTHWTLRTPVSANRTRGIWISGALPWIACGSRKKNYCRGSPAAEAKPRPALDRLRQPQKNYCCGSPAADAKQTCPQTERAHSFPFKRSFQWSHIPSELFPKPKDTQRKFSVLPWRCTPCITAEFAVNVDRKQLRSCTTGLRRIVVYLQ